LPDEVANISVNFENTNGVISVGMSNGYYKLNQNSSKVSPVFLCRIPENIPLLFIERKNNTPYGSQN